ncbi:unnamed protein product [Oncorhynchus mykiss]|uniref:Serine-threonine/tyrosine-protein kinase catalytic domain-containing protein n=1 Tax=Oncorhynchus mykiss TaxID=8022 RepID=A0A060Y4W8_ONCMY|nr:unnamed protein product [Oncorhynchus mykiss]
MLHVLFFSCDVEWVSVVFLFSLRSLGVTIWELFELGNQPYRQYSDRQVLTYAVREQQLRLPKPLLKIPLAERWYEVMQFCWLQPDQRPNTEEVHLLLSYLCAKGASEAEEDFERRWNSLRPNPNADQRSSSLHHGAGALATGTSCSGHFLWLMTTLYSVGFFLMSRTRCASQKKTETALFSITLVY